MQIKAGQWVKLKKYKELKRGGFRAAPRVRKYLGTIQRVTGLGRDIIFIDNYLFSTDCVAEVYDSYPLFMLVADFSNAKVGDRVKCLACGAGEIIIIDKTNKFSIVVRRNSGKTDEYNIYGQLSYNYEPTLFYHFDGQFPTAEACKRPAPDPYELHGVTREDIEKYADAVELVLGWYPTMCSWDKNGAFYFYSEKTEPLINNWNVKGLSVQIAKFDHCGPYEHWQTPIILDWQ